MKKRRLIGIGFTLSIIILVSSVLTKPTDAGIASPQKKSPIQDEITMTPSPTPPIEATSFPCRFRTTPVDPNNQTGLSRGTGFNPTEVPEGYPTSVPLPTLENGVTTPPDLPECP